MANRTVTVKSSGGDYTSLNAALAGESGDLVANTRILTVECYAMEDTTAANTGSGYVTSASYYINITVPTSERHQGTWSASAYRLVPSTTCLVNQAGWTRTSGLQLWVPSGGYVSGIVAYAGSGKQVWIDACIVKGGGGVGNSHAAIACAYLGYGTYNISNCVVYDWQTTGYKCAAILSNTSDTAYIDNCTICGCATGVNNSDSMRLRNTLLSGCGSDGVASLLAGSGYNATTQSVSLGGFTGDRLSQTFTFVDAANKDYHLAASDAGAKGYGTDLSGSFTTDIDGETRSAPWDIGADQYVAAAEYAPLFFRRPMRHLRLR